MSAPPPAAGGLPGPRPLPLPSPSLRGPEGWRRPVAAPRRDRLPLEDLALLLLAALALVLPGLFAAPSAGRPRLAGAPEAPRRIDANRSAWYEWTLLPGIGEVRARRIVGLREARGGFRSLADLDRLPGLPRGWTEKVRPFLSFPEVPGAEPVPAGVPDGVPMVPRGQPSRESPRNGR